MISKPASETNSESDWPPRLGRLSAWSEQVPKIAIAEKAVSKKEREALVELARDRLGAARVLDAKGDPEISSKRTGQACFADPAARAALGWRMSAASLWGVPLERVEGVQIARYREGEGYEDHFDWIEPTALGRGRPQREATMLLYLRAPKRGGATRFTAAGWRVEPLEGRAVWFEYPEGDLVAKALSLHASEPVIEGEKWVATLWRLARHPELGV